MKIVSPSHLDTVADRTGGEIAFTQNSRDYKGVMVIVISESDRSADGEYSSRELQRTGRIQRHVCNGEEE